jgi:hypothetical protein
MNKSPKLSRRSSKGREPRSHENLDQAEVSRRSDERKVLLDLPQAHRR